jgi:hypothetical protein
MILGFKYILSNVARASALVIVSEFVRPTPRNLKVDDG